MMSIGMAVRPPRNVSPLQRALAAIRRNNGSAWWVPDSLTNSGIYTDSTGATPVSAVGDVLGLLTDRSYGAGNLGVELVSNGGNPFTSTNGWTALNAKGNISLVGGRLRNTATAQFDSGLFTTLPAFAVAGRRLAVTVDVYQSTAGRGILFYSGGELYYTVWMPSGYSRVTFIAPQSSISTHFYVRFAGAVEQVGDYFEIASISVREVLGNHATQATAQYKPVIARVPRKLGPELVPGSPAPITATEYREPPMTLVVGRSYQVKASITKTSGTTIQVGVTNSAYGWHTGNPYTVSANGTESVNFTFVATDSVARFTAIFSSAVGSVSSYTVREVLEWSNAIKFDGSNDRLVISAPQPTTELTFIFAANFVGTATQILTNSGVNGAGLYRTGGFMALDKSGVGLALSSAFPDGPAVISVVSAPGNRRMYRNGELIASDTATVSFSSTGPYSIGASDSGGNPFAEWISDVALFNTAIPDADRKTIERNMAQRAGATYLG